MSMRYLVTRTINIAGAIFRRGADVTDEASPGEIASLLAGGYVTGWDDETPAQPVPTTQRPTTEVADEPESESPGGGGDPEPIDPPIDSLELAGPVIELLTGAGITTVGQARDYLAEHGSFQPITGIGKVTSNLIVGLLG